MFYKYLIGIIPVLVALGASSDVSQAIHDGQPAESLTSTDSEVQNTTAVRIQNNCEVTADYMDLLESDDDGSVLFASCGGVL